MKVDNVKTIEFPDSAVWADFYERFRDALVKSLNSGFSLADREDAVEEAFHKLMHKKDCEAYGEKLPKTESDWYCNLRWQARSYLSHLRGRDELHAKYVETASRKLADMFACGHQGEAMDADIRSRALIRALEMLKEEQDIPRRNLEIYVALEMGEKPVKDLSRLYGITENNVYQIKFRTRRLLRKHGPRCFERALRKEGYATLAFVA